MKIKNVNENTSLQFLKLACSLPAAILFGYQNINFQHQRVKNSIQKKYRKVVTMVFVEYNYIYSANMST